MTCAADSVRMIHSRDFAWDYSDAVHLGKRCGFDLPLLRELLLPQVHPSRVFGYLALSTISSNDLGVLMHRCVVEFILNVWRKADLNAPNPFTQGTLLNLLFSVF